MSQASDYAEAAFLDHIFGLATLTEPATLYLALFTTSQDDDGGATEVAGGDYARVAITNDGTSWSRTAQTVSNLNIISFAQATASWGNVTHWALFDAASGGNFWFYGALTSPETIGNGDTYRIAVGNLTVTYNAASNFLAGEMLDHFFGLGDYTPPDPLYIAKFSAAPTNSGGGTELTGGSYARVSVAAGAAQWTRTANLVVNDNAIQFPAATANQGTAVAAAIMDAATVGNMLAWGALSTNRTINNGSQFEFSAGQFRMRLD